jgi:hypothetical protein
MRYRLFSIITGGLSGCVVGWIWGNAIVDEPDVWVFASLICMIAGLLAGFNPNIREQIGAYLGAIVGLYLGWIAKVMIFGNSPAEWSLTILVVGMIGGAELGAKAADRSPRLTEAVLLNVLYAGVLGGLFVDVVLLDVIFGWRTDHSVLAQAPIIMTSGTLGGLAAILSFGREE